MFTVAELLATQSLCLNCLVKQTGLRSDVVSRQLETVGARFADGGCATSEECGPAFTLLPA